MNITEYCDFNPIKSNNIPPKYKNLILSNFIIYEKIKTLCALLPNVNEDEQNKIKPLLKQLISDWEKNDLEITIEERYVKPIDPYNREIRISTSNLGLISSPEMNPSEDIIECPSNADFDPYEFVADELKPSNDMFITTYEGKNQTVDYSKMNYHLTKNTISEQDIYF